MYIMVEHPKEIVRGEQIGIRVTVFNYWYDDDYIEVCNGFSQSLKKPSSGMTTNKILHS